MRVWLGRIRLGPPDRGGQASLILTQPGERFMLELNHPAPEFTLPDQDGTDRSLADYRGQWVLLFFYPKDDTPG